jgi:ketosteroid isomerase-like protein
MSSPTPFSDAIPTIQHAVASFVNGDLEPWLALCSRADDASLFGGWGGHEVGWQQLGPRYEWANARFSRSGQTEVTFDLIASHTSGDLACTIWIERSQVRLAGQAETAPMALRVTQIYRHEADGWKLLHRHADPIATIQVPESVLAAS